MKKLSKCIILLSLLATYACSKDNIVNNQDTIVEQYDTINWQWKAKTQLESSSAAWR